MSTNQNLGQSARSALLLGGAFHLIKDFAQFGAMLVMVRLLTPEDYGSAALAQAFLGLIAVFSFGTFSTHALQFREPLDVDWQVHFTAATVINGTLFVITLVIAWALSSTQRYQTAALPLAGFAITFLIEIPGTLRHRMLETRHDWVRFRLLLIIGTLLGLVIGLIIAFMGGGVWALVVQPPLFGLPAAIDLFWRNHWRPDWSWSWMRYRETARFGFNRMGAAAAIRGRDATQQTVMAGAYDFATLGVFSRTLGLATLVAGRVGSVAMQALYPVVTRMEKKSARFQRIAGLLLQGVCWTIIPAAVFFALNAEDTVTLLYGQQWLSVIPLLPVALLGVAFTGIASTLSSLLLANDEARLCLSIDIYGALIVVGLAIWLIPSGVIVYLAALAGHAFLLMLITLFALVMTKGISANLLMPAFFPAIVATSGAAISIEALAHIQPGDLAVGLQLAQEVIIFSLVYIAALRLFFTTEVRGLLKIAPGGIYLTRFFLLGEERADV